MNTMKINEMLGMAKKLPGKKFQEWLTLTESGNAVEKDHNNILTILNGSGYVAPGYETKILFAKKSVIAAILNKDEYYINEAIRRIRLANHEHTNSFY